MKDNSIKYLDTEAIKDNAQITDFKYRLNKMRQDIDEYRNDLENLKNNYPDKNVIRHINDKKQELLNDEKNFFLANNIHTEDKKAEQILLKNLSLVDSYIIREQTTLALSKQALERKNRKEELEIIAHNIMIESSQITNLQIAIKEILNKTITLNHKIDQAQYLRKILSTAKTWEHNLDEGPLRWKSFFLEIRQGKWLFAEELNRIINNILTREKLSNLIQQFELALGKDSFAGLLIIISLLVSIVLIVLSWSLIALSQQVAPQAWCAKLIAVLAYLLSERSREEWIGDLREIRDLWEEENYHHLVISIYIFGLAMKLIWAHLYCKIYDIVWKQYLKRPE